MRRHRVSHHSTDLPSDDRRAAFRQHVRPRSKPRDGVRVILSFLCKNRATFLGVSPGTDPRLGKGRPASTVIDRGARRSATGSRGREFLG